MSVSLFSGRLLLHLFHFRLDDEGKFKAISHNNGVRAPYMNLPVADVKSWYKSMACLDGKLNAKENMIQFKLKEGNQTILEFRSFFGSSPDKFKNTMCVVGVVFVVLVLLFFLSKPSLAHFRGSIGILLT